MADHLDAEADSRLDQVGEVLGQPSGPDDEHVALVEAPAAEEAEDGAQDQSLREGDERLCHEQGEQEEAADIVLVRDEEQGERDRRHQDRGARDVLGLGAQLPAHAQRYRP